MIPAGIRHQLGKTDHPPYEQVTTESSAADAADEHRDRDHLAASSRASHILPDGQPTGTMVPVPRASG